MVNLISNQKIQINQHNLISFIPNKVAPKNQTNNSVTTMIPSAMKWTSEDLPTGRGW